MNHGAVVSPDVKPISVSLTFRDGEVRVPFLNRSPGSECGPWAVVGLVADFVPKRGIIVWGRVDVSLAIVPRVLHFSKPFVARISSTVLGGMERVMYAFTNVEFVTQFCRRCVGL